MPLRIPCFPGNDNPRTLAILIVSLSLLFRLSFSVQPSGFHFRGGPESRT